MRDTLQLIIALVALLGCSDRRAIRWMGIDRDWRNNTQNAGPHPPRPFAALGSMW